jgi:hypothetical protein
MPGFPLTVQSMGGWTSDFAGLESLIQHPPVDRRSFGILQWATSLRETGAKVSIVVNEQLTSPAVAAFQAFPRVLAATLIGDLYERKDCSQL